MTMNRVDTLLLVVAVSGIIAAARTGFTTPATPWQRPANQPAAPTPVERPSAAVITGVTESIVAADPFRLSHEPPNADASVATTSQSAPAVQRPKLQALGVVGPAGALMAIVSGLPGATGDAFIREGQTIGGVTADRVTRNSVVLHGLDTTWSLPVRAEWDH